MKFIRNSSSPLPIDRDRQRQRWSQRKEIRETEDERRGKQEKGWTTHYGTDKGDDQERKVEKN